MTIKALRQIGKENAKRDCEKSAVLRRVPQKRPSPYEIASYAAVPLLLIAAGAMPSVAVFLLPAILPMLYLLFRRFGATLPFCCIGFYGLFSLVFNYDILTVVFFVAMEFALAGLILSSQVTPYLLCYAVAAVAAVAGAALGFGIVRLAEGEPLGDIAAHYVQAESDDPFISFLARRYYADFDIPEDIGRLDKTDPGYAAATIEFYSEYIQEEFSHYVPYYCVHFGGVYAMLAYFIAVAINRKTSSAYDVAADEKTVAASSRVLGGVRREMTPIDSMRIPRAYLWAVFLPGLIASMLLDFVGGYDALSATVMHVFVTIPPAFAFVTVMLFFASLFHGKGRIAAYAVCFLLFAAMVYVPVVFFFCSIVGLCDIILNLRFWTHFIKDD